MGREEAQERQGHPGQDEPPACTSCRGSRCPRAAVPGWGLWVVGLVLLEMQVSSSTDAPWGHLCSHSFTPTCSLLPSRVLSGSQATSAAQPTPPASQGGPPEPRGPLRLKGMLSGRAGQPALGGMETWFTV